MIKDLISEVHCVDNIEYMATIPDKFFDLVIADPPYGSSIMKKNKFQRFGTTDTTYRNKTIPPKEFYSQIERISNNSIIWGCQYQIQHLSANGSFIVWDKKADPDLHNMSAVDIAWYSKRDRIRKFTGHWCGAVKCESEPTIHIHQKPISLYKWLLKHYAKPGDKIFDPNMGSQSSRIACYDMGFDYWGCELDEYYFDAGNNRFNQHIKQGVLF